MSDFPFEHLHWTMELKTAVRTPHVSNWLSCWGFSQRWANKSFLMKSAFLWIITGCALWINPRVSDCQSREEEPLNCGSCHHVPAHSKLKTHQHNLLLPPSVLLRFICLALHFLYFFFCLFFGGGAFLLICLGFCNQWSHGKLWPNRSFCSCTTKRYLSVWVASIKGSYTLRLRFCLATLFLPFMKRFVVNVKDQQVMIWICLHSENELWQHEPLQPRFHYIQYIFGKVKAGCYSMLSLSDNQVHSYCYTDRIHSDKCIKKQPQTFFSPVDTAAPCRVDLVSHCVFSVSVCVSLSFKHTL